MIRTGRCQINPNTTSLSKKVLHLKVMDSLNGLGVFLLQLIAVLNVEFNAVPTLSSTYFRSWQFKEVSVLSL